MKFRLALAALMSIGLVALLPLRADAHVTLVASDPVAGSTVVRLPEAVTLTFAAPLVDNPALPTNLITVIDPMGAMVSTATVRHGVFLSTVLSPAMIMQGAYHVNYRSVAQDGTVQEGSFSFFVNSHAKSGGTVPKIAVPTTGTVHLVANATGADILNNKGLVGATASAAFTIDFAKQTLCYRITTHSLPNVSAVHIHSSNTMNMSVSDEIFVPINVAAVNAARPLCSKPGGQALAWLAKDPTRYVMMVHTPQYPEGAAMGPITPPIPVPVASSVATATVATVKGVPHLLWLVLAAIVLIPLIIFGASYLVGRLSEAPRELEDAAPAQVA